MSILYDHFALRLIDFCRARLPVFLALVGDCDLCNLTEAIRKSHCIIRYCTRINSQCFISIEHFPLFGCDYRLHVTC